MTENIIPSLFLEKAEVPDEEKVLKALGKLGDRWMKLKTEVKNRFSPCIGNWKYSGKKHGWTLQLQQKKRTVLYMTPCPGFIRVSFAFGDKAVAAAHQSDLPKSILDDMDGAKKYAEGRPVRVEMKTKKEMDLVLKLAAIKMAN